MIFLVNFEIKNLLYDHELFNKNKRKEIRKQENSFAVKYPYLSHRLHMIYITNLLKLHLQLCLIFTLLILGLLISLI